MARGARVRSVEVLGSLRAAIGVYIEELEGALAGAESETNRTIDWLRGTQLAYWSKEIVRRREIVTRAKSAMFRAEAHTPREMGKSNVDERKALERAKRALKEAEIKHEQTKRLGISLERVATTYRGQVSQLARLASGDLPEAMELLKRLERGLDNYLAFRPQDPNASDAGAGAHAGKSIANTRTNSHPQQGVAARWSSLLPTRQQRRESQSGELGSLTGPLVRHESVDAIAAYSKQIAAEQQTPTPLADRVLLIEGWKQAESLLFYRSDKPTIGDSGWVLADAEAVRARGESEPHAALSWVRAEDLVETFPEIDTLLAFPFETGVVLGEPAVGRGRLVDLWIDERRTRSNP